MSILSVIPLHAATLSMNPFCLPALTQSRGMDEEFGVRPKYKYLIYTEIRCTLLFGYCFTDVLQSAHLAWPTAV